MSSNITETSRLTQDDGNWVLIVDRVLSHSVEDVWAALTKADQIPSWGPFKPDRDLTTVGPVKLAHIDMPEAEERPGYVLEVSAPHLLMLHWGPDILRWELKQDGDKTNLVLRHSFMDSTMAPSYAAGWNLCLKGLTGTLAGEKMPCMAGHNAIKHGWQELYDQYVEAFGVGTH